MTVVRGRFGGSPPKRPAAGKPDKTTLELDPAAGPQPPKEHLGNVLREAEQLFDKGEWAKGLESMGHAVFVAATTGKQGLTDTELIHKIRRITGYGYTPGEAA